MYTPGQNGVNNKPLVGKLARIKKNKNKMLVYFSCSELFVGEKLEKGKFTYIVFLYAKVKS